MSNQENYAENSRIKIVTNPDEIKILVDPMRRKILRTMREGMIDEDGKKRKEMTVPEIAAKLGLPKEQSSKLYHHIDKLLKTGFIRVAREEKITRSIITYYERTAPGFVSVDSIDEIERKEGVRSELFINLINDAFLLDLDEDQKQKAQALIDEYTSKYHKIVVSSSKQFKGNISDHERLASVVNFIASLYASQDTRIQEIQKELMKFINVKLD
jgi:DNA-binding transcriptional ArsR family regulator